jgi:transmembrane sensor
MNWADAHSEPPTGNGAIDDVAADWLARRVRGLTRHEHAEFIRWREADQRHAAAFAELEATWRALDGLSEITLPDGRSLDHDVPVAPAMRETRAVGRGARRAVWLATAIAAAAAIAVVFRPAREAQALALNRVAATETGGFQKLTLPDRSIVRLNTDSAVEVDFSPGVRRVTLTRGEASFEVAKDPARPFVVRAGKVAVCAVGTAFNVRFYPEVVDVLVTEGKVRVDHALDGHSLLNRAADGGGAPVESDASEPGVLVAGHRVTIAQNGSMEPAKVAVTAVAPAEAARELAWQDRRLEFIDAPLRDVVTEFNRYNRHKLVIVDARLNERRFGGIIRADNGEAFVRLLESRFSVRAERREAETLLRAVE